MMSSVDSLHWIGFTAEVKGEARRLAFGKVEHQRSGGTAQGKLAEALAEYDGILSRYPEGDRAASARFRKGLTLLQMEKRQEGIDALKSVVSLHPNTRESGMAKAELIRLGEAAR